jgi:hypothetical protein
VARYQQPSGKNKYRQTDPVYGTFEKEVVDAGIATGDFVLMERTVHAKIDGQLVGRPDRRYMPAGDVRKLEARGWSVVELSGSERAATIGPKKVAGSKGPAA